MTQKVRFRNGLNALRTGTDGRPKTGLIFYTAVRWECITKKESCRDAGGRFFEASAL
jgi:hypothetical protein